MMRKVYGLVLVVFGWSCSSGENGTTQPSADSTSAPAAAGSQAETLGDLTDQRVFGAFKLEVWKSQHERPYNLTMVSRDAKGVAVDRLAFCGDCGVAAAEGGEFERTEYAFPDKDIVEVKVTNSRIMDASAIDPEDSEEDAKRIMLAWDNPYDVVERNFDSLTTTRYRIGKAGKFEILEGYPQPQLLEEHWSGLAIFDQLPQSNLRILRNAVYAKYGLRFKSKDLQEHFGKKEDYKPRFDDVDDMLSPLDQNLVAYLKALESK